MNMKLFNKESSEQVESLESQITYLQSTVETKDREIESFKDQVSDLQGTIATDKVAADEAATTAQAEIDSLKADLQTAQEEVETLKAQLSEAESSAESKAVAMVKEAGHEAITTPSEEETKPEGSTFKRYLELKKLDPRAAAKFFNENEADIKAGL